MSKFPWFWLAVMCMALPVTLVADEEGGFNLSKLNPFASRADDPEAKPKPSPRERASERSPADEESGSGFAWPTLPKPKWPSLPKLTTTTTTRRSMGRSAEPEGPSMWEKFSNGTKGLYSKSKSTLMPWTADSAAAGKSGATGSRPSMRTSTRPKSKTEKKPFFSTWLGEKEEPRPIQSVNDYLSLPRVPYE